MNNEEITFGAWLRTERRKLDLSRQAFADQVGCAEITLRRIEGGSLKPSRQLAVLLLEKIGIPEAEREAWIQFARGLAGYPIQAGKTTPTNSPSNLPVYLTTFVGRAKEITEILNLIDQHRLVTLTGPGGVGKTRMAGRAGEQIMENFPDGVFMAELASQTAPELIPQTIASMLGIATQSRTSYMELLINFMRPRKVLLILDNCEHLLQACAFLAEELLKHCPDLRILATSREALQVMGEALYQAPGMGFPDEKATLDKFREFESIELFIERARLVQSDFSLQKEDIPSMVQICQRVDGIPLAIELAAARVDVLSIEQIAQRLQDSFDLLAHGSLTALPRQQTIYNSIEWSWNLLTQAEQTLLRRFSVFAGGWTLEAAQVVCSGNGIKEREVADLLTHLSAKSLVRVSQGAGRYKRYKLHEMIRQFALDRIQASEADNIRKRHLKYFLGWSEKAEFALHGPQQLDWLNQLGEELDNLRAALTWALATDTESGLAIIGCLSNDLDLCEGLDWVYEFLARPDSHKYPQARAKALLAQADYTYTLQQFDTAEAAAKEALELFRQCGDSEGEFGCLMTLGSITQFKQGMDGKLEYHLKAMDLAHSLGDAGMQARALNALGWDRRNHEQSIRFWQESVRLYRQAGDWRSLAFLLAIFGDTLLAYGETESAQAMLEESFELNHRLKYKQGMEFVLVGKSRQAFLNKDYDQARTYLEDWIKLAEELGNRMGLLYSRARLGYIALFQGNLDEGFQILRDTVTNFQKDQNQAGLAFTLERLAHYYALSDLPDRCARLIGWADATREKTGDIRPPTEQVELERDIAACKDKLGEKSYSQARDKGRHMTLDEAAALAMS